MAHTSGKQYEKEKEQQKRIQDILKKFNKAAAPAGGGDSSKK